MKILVVNDDGYTCQGMIKLATALMKQHEVIVVAPHKCNSGMAHAMTFNKPVYVKEVKDFPYPCYSVTGTPADCVKLGMELTAVDGHPDLVISGINTEPNIGTDVVYSGTANAAMEACLEGVPAIALSTLRVSDDDYDYVIDLFMSEFDYYVSLTSTESAININFNNRETGNLGKKITPLGKRKFSDIYIVGDEDARGIPHSLVGNPLPINNDEDCDVIWYHKGYITITPLTADNTLYTAIRKLKTVPDGGND